MFLARVDELFGIPVGASLGCSRLWDTFPCPSRERLWHFSWQLSCSEITSLVTAAFRFLIVAPQKTNYSFPEGRCLLFSMVPSDLFPVLAFDCLYTATPNALTTSSSLIPLLVFFTNDPPHGQEKTCKRMQLLLHKCETFGCIEYNWTLFHTQRLSSFKILVWRALENRWGINSAMTRRSTTEAILCAIIKWHFLALRTVESWPVIIMRKIIFNPPGQSPQTAGRVYPETKKSAWKIMSLVPLSWKWTKALE